MAAESRSSARELTAVEYYQQLTTRDVQKLIGAKSKRTVWTYVEQGILPKPRYQKPHRPVWRLGECIEALERHTQAYEDAPRAFRGSPKLDEFTPPRTKQESSHLADKVRERLGIKKSK
jgi:predicted DNA-binding transcriptional regulator AlpA